MENFPLYLILKAISGKQRGAILILSDNELIENMETFVGHKDQSLVNPASIRVGKYCYFGGIGKKFNLKDINFVLKKTCTGSFFKDK